MKEWHVVVLEGHKTIYDKIFFNINDAKVDEKAKREQYKPEVEAKKYRVVREFY